MPKPYDPRDFYYRQAQKKGLRARSAFKIEEIADRFRLLKAGMAVLDLGAAPGGWLQVMAERVGPRGVIVGVDLVPIAPLGRAWVHTLELDMRAPDFAERLAAVHSGAFDLVTSDMAPKTIGVRITDEARSLELAGLALDTARKTLRPGGAFVCKLFMGAGYEEFLRSCRAVFAKAKTVRPEATRERSFECYLVCVGRRP